MTLDMAERDGVQLQLVGLKGMGMVHDKTIEQNHEWGGELAASQCDVAPYTWELEHLVALNKWDYILFEFGLMIAARRTKAVPGPRFTRPPPPPRTPPPMGHRTLQGKPVE